MLSARPTGGPHGCGAHPVTAASQRHRPEGNTRRPWTSLLYAWVITVVVMAAILAVDVFIIGRRPHEPSMTEAGVFIGVFATLAVVFGLGMSAVLASKINSK